jgi:hypothetical protein
VDLLFKESDGLAPLFNLVDEGSRPDADISTKDARVETFKETLLKRGLTRFTSTNWTGSTDPLTQVRGILVGGARLHEQRDLEAFLRAL